MKPFRSKFQDKNYLEVIQNIIFWRLPSNSYPITVGALKACYTVTQFATDSSSIPVGSVVQIKCLGT